MTFSLDLISTFFLWVLYIQLSYKLYLCLALATPLRESQFKKTTLNWLYNIISSYRKTAGTTFYFILFMEKSIHLKNASDNLIVIFIYFDVHVIRLSIFIGTLY